MILLRVIHKVPKLGGEKGGPAKAVLLVWARGGNQLQAYVRKQMSYSDNQSYPFPSSPYS